MILVSMLNAGCAWFPQCAIALHVYYVIKESFDSQLGRLLLHHTLLNMHQWDPRESRCIYVQCRVEYCSSDTMHIIYDIMFGSLYLFSSSAC